MKYDIEADWHLLDTCNYRCAYCFLSPDTLGSKLRTFASADEWRSAFDLSENVWLLHMTGGEPSIYPEFVELCESVTVNHYISVNSNLTQPSLARFADRIDPARVSFINAGLHLEERERRSGHGAFLRNADRLLRCGFPILVSAVATPTALARFEEAIRLLQPIGLFPIPKLFRGTCDGKTYPQGYSLLDRERFQRFSRMAREAYAPLLAKMAQRPSIDICNDHAFLDGLPTYTGSMCEAGDRFVYIKPNGDVFRCGAQHFQGNLLVGQFARRSGASPCNSQHCYYFCNKYSDAATRSVAVPEHTKT